MDPKLLEILVCPICKGPLMRRTTESDLVCKPCRIAFQIQDGIPVMLVDEAIALPPDLEL
jgi:uncharacterized protein YbaR (Trm112 family)